MSIIDSVTLVIAVLGIVNTWIGLERDGPS